MLKWPTSRIDRLEPALGLARLPGVGLEALSARAATARMPLRVRALVLAMSFACIGSQALAEPGDELGKFMGDRGFVERIEQRASEIGAQISDTASNIVMHAMGFLGVPYKRGGNSAETGFDCSGFVRAMYEQTVGLILPRRAAEQAAATTPIDKSELQPGDLVFFNTLRATFSHVGIYVGDNKFIHSPRSGATVRVEDMRVPYWQTRFDGARRVQASAQTPAPAPTAVSTKTSVRGATPAAPRSNARPTGHSGSANNSPAIGDTMHNN